MAQQVRKGEELNELPLKEFLYKEELIKNTSSEISITQFKNGFSNLTYLLEIEDQSLVLRKPPLGAIKRGHDMGREFKVLSGLNKGFAKAPKAFAYSEDPNIIGSSFYIMQKMEGIILSTRETIQRNIPAAQFPKIANTWMDTFVELHQLNYHSIGLEDLGKPDGYVERQVSNWSKQYLKAATDEIPVAPKVMDWLLTNQPKQYAHTLIHNDYKYDNVVFADDTWSTINAVLDWEMCTLGDPLMDLGTSLAYWSTAEDHPMILKGLPSPTSMAGNPSRTDVVEMYAQRSGRPIDHLIFYYAFGLFKLAVIVQQIYYRYAKGLTTDKRFSKLNEATQLFLTMASQAIQKKRIDQLF